jgi:uncharacterized membrane protein YhfC
LSALPFLAIALALVPAIFLAVYFARASLYVWLSFVIGFVGWIAAIVLRLVPLQLPLILNLTSSSSTVYVIYAAILAGVFEEGIRYLLVKKIRYTGESFRSILSFGLGWGISEASIIYGAAAIFAIITTPSISFFDLLPGAVERNSAIMLHVALSLLVLKAAKGHKRFLFLAMFIHASDDAFAVLFADAVYNIWLTESAILVISVIILLVILANAGIRKRNNLKEHSTMPASSSIG